MNEDKIIEIRKVVKKAFIRIGIRCDMLGFKYLCQCTEELILNPELIDKLCKGLYKKVAERNNIEKSNNVERAMRNVIDMCFELNGFLELNKMFKMNIFTIDDKPTTGELIKLIAEFYDLDLWKE